MELYLRARKASFPSFSRFPSFTLNRKRGVSFSLAGPISRIGVLQNHSLDGCASAYLPILTTSCRRPLPESLSWVMIYSLASSSEVCCPPQSSVGWPVCPDLERLYCTMPAIKRAQESEFLSPLFFILCRHLARAELPYLINN